MKNKIVRLAFITVLILFIPLIGVLVTDEVNWGLFDFIVMGGLIFGMGLIYQLIASNVQDVWKRAIIGMIVLGAFLLVWADLAVGIFNIPGFSGN